MVINNKIKYIVSSFLVIISFFSGYSQEQQPIPLEISADFGIPFELPAVKLFNKNSIPSYKQFGFRLQKKITNKTLLGIDLQLTKNNVKNEFIKSFKSEFNNATTEIRFSNYNVTKLIVNYGYFRKNTKGNFEISACIGLGIQVNSSNNIENTGFSGPGDVARDVYNSAIYVVSKDFRFANPLLQLTIDNTYFVTKKLGITCSIKTQYQSILKPQVFLVYDEFSDRYDTGLFGTRKVISEVISDKKSVVTIIPTLGIKYLFEI